MSFALYGFVTYIRAHRYCTFIPVNSTARHLSQHILSRTWLEITYILSIYNQQQSRDVWMNTWILLILTLAYRITSCYNKRIPKRNWRMWTRKTFVNNKRIMKEETKGEKKQRRRENGKEINRWANKLTKEIIKEVPKHNLDWCMYKYTMMYQSNTIKLYYF